jgi:hypothetical protein
MFHKNQNQMVKAAKKKILEQKKEKKVFLKGKDV